MPPRGYKRTNYQEDYSDDSVEIASKLSKQEWKEDSSNQHVLDNASFDEAVEILKKQRDENLLLIKTEHEMRIDSANKLAKFEEERLQEFYENELKEVKRKILEERNQSNKRNTFENTRKHRMIGLRNEDHHSKKEDVTLTIPLEESTAIDDIKYMMSEYAKTGRTSNMVVVLPGNRLMVNDLFIEPGMKCLLTYKSEIMIGQLILVDAKELIFKPEKEKRKKFSMDLVKSGELKLSYLPDDMIESVPVENVSMS